MGSSPICTAINIVSETIKLNIMESLKPAKAYKQQGFELNNQVWIKYIQELINQAHENKVTYIVTKKLTAEQAEYLVNLGFAINYTMSIPRKPDNPVRISW